MNFLYQKNRDWHSEACWKNSEKLMVYLLRVQTISDWLSQDLSSVETPQLINLLRELD